MKIISSILILLLVCLLVSAGCTSEEDSAEGESPDLNDASTVFH